VPTQRHHSINGTEGAEGNARVESGVMCSA
jgi:hypothetical protein